MKKNIVSLIIVLCLVISAAVIFYDNRGNKAPEIPVTVIDNRIYHFDLSAIQEENRIHVLNEKLKVLGVEPRDIQQAKDNPAIFLVTKK